MKKLFISILILFFSNFAIADEWSQWKSINANAIPLSFNNINNVIGDLNPDAWKTEASFDGSKAFQIWVENYSNIGSLIIDYIKFPPTWVIKGSANDRNYIKEAALRLLGVDKKNNPLKNLSKSEIERYRDTENNVVPYVFFSFENQVCIIFNKGYYKREDGFINSPDDDETLTVLFCKYEGNISESDVNNLIDGIQVKQ
tara:strand:+ start:103 stop:702 length:600 start_codon:yes stop_codon:yes gene_type:complete